MSGETAMMNGAGGGGTVRPAECEHDPDESTAYRAGSLPAVLARDTDVRVDAKCTRCGEWIRRAPAEPGTAPEPWGLKYPERSS